MKRLTFLVLSSFFAALVLFASPLGAEEKTESIDKNKVPQESSSPEKYIKYLEKQQSEKSSVNLSSTDATNTALSQFENLTKEEQEQYLEYINDPAVLNEMYEVADSLEIKEGETSTSAKLDNKDIVVTTEKAESPKYGARASYNYSDDWNTTFSIKGVEVTKVNIYMQWTSESTSNGCCSITSVNDYTHAVVNNLIPLQDVTPTERLPYITGSNDATAIYAVLWSVSYDYDGIGVGVSSFMQEMTAIGTGSSVIDSYVVD